MTYISCVQITLECVVCTSITISTLFTCWISASGRRCSALGHLRSQTAVLASRYWMFKDAADSIRVFSVATTKQVHEVSKHETASEVPCSLFSTRSRSKVLRARHRLVGWLTWTGAMEWSDIRCICCRAAEANHARRKWPLVVLVLVVVVVNAISVTDELCARFMCITAASLLPLVCVVLNIT